MVPAEKRTPKSAEVPPPSTFVPITVPTRLQIPLLQRLVSESYLNWEILLAAVLVIAGAAALWLRSVPLHEDEAIYAAWALALRGDWWLSQTPVDKPPLFFYPLALSLALFGPTEAAARFPNLLATVAAAFFVYRLVVVFRGRTSAAGAVFLFLAAPLTQAHVASAFTDPLMLALALGAAERAHAGRARASGLLLGLALVTKPTALFLSPFVLGLGSIAECTLKSEGFSSGSQPRAFCVSRVQWTDEESAGQFCKGGLSTPDNLQPCNFQSFSAGTFSLRSFGLALMAVLLAAWAWDAARFVPSWWVLGEQAYGSLGRPSAAVGTWARWLLFGLGPVAAALLLAFWGRGSRAARLRGVVHPNRRSYGVLWGTLVLALPVHLLLGFQPWDRYLLPLAALLAVAAGWRLPRPERAALVAALLALPLVQGTAAGATGLGGRDGRWAGIAALGAAVRVLPPDATVLYTDVGRPLAFYAYGTRAMLRWAPDAHALAALADEAAGPVFLAARAETLPAPCRPSATSNDGADAAFILVPLDGACHTELVR